MEQELIDWLQQRQLKRPEVDHGIGDDAAVLRLPHAAVAADMLVEGTHFDLQECSLAQVGHKALGVNLSDLAAMGAQPVCAFVTLTLPRRELQTAREIMQGMLDLADRFQLQIAGGDTNCGGDQIVVSVTVIGTPHSRGPLLRNGARSGDWLLVTGPLGGSRLGRHLLVEPRIEAARYLLDQCELHAGMDISDGLALDLSRMTRASDCGAELIQEQIPIHEDAINLASQSGKPAWQHALGDGEDFELLLALPEATARPLLESQPVPGVTLSHVGHCVSSPELTLLQPSGTSIPLPMLGYQH